MAKKQSIKENSENPALRSLAKMRRLELKKECVGMGMPFAEAAGASNLQLSSWYIANYSNRYLAERLKEFDDWFELEMLGKGKDPDDPKDSHFFNPLLRLSYTGDPDEVKQLKLDLVDPKPKKVKAIKEAPKPKVKDEVSGVVKGTKKAYTFRLAQNTEKNYSDARIIKKVLIKFPDANEKSIKIWIKKAKKSNA